MVEKTYPGLSERNLGWWPTVVDPLRMLGQRVADFFTPHVDAASTKEAYEINMELPGVTEKDIEITIQENALIVKGEKTEEKEDKGKTYYFSERSYGAFRRTFRLPDDVDAEKVSADFAGGVLTIKVPKVTPKIEPEKRVKISTH